MTMPEMDAFAREAERTEQTLRTIGPHDWTEPALGEWNLAELVVHLVRQADLLAAYRDCPLSETTAAVDRHTYYRDAAVMADRVAHTPDS